jgi:hypothetical protein
VAINKFIIEKGFYLINEQIREENQRTLVNYPSWKQDRFDLLDEYQKYEYSTVFTNTLGTGHFFEKYYKTRVSELLLYMMCNFSTLNHNNFENEIKFFSKMFNNKFKLYSMLYDFYSQFKKIDIEERDQKMSVLLSIDDPFRQYSIFSTDVKYGEHKKRIEINQSYLRFINLNTSEIVNYKNTGILPEKNIDYNEWLKEKSRFEQIVSNNELAKKREQAINSSSFSPAMVIGVLEPYLNYIISESKSFPLEEVAFSFTVADFQIGYDINKLTAAYGKLKVWDKVIYWSELYFSLNANYRSRSSYSEQEAIRKRLERARRIHLKNY